MTYHVGPGPAKVHLHVKFNWDRKPLYDVIATIPGSKYPDEWVIRGNHHDAWVNGADDPISGASPELEEARALGELLKQGWKPNAPSSTASGMAKNRACSVPPNGPRRTPTNCKQHAVAYINSDGNGRGFFRAGGSHSLERFVNGVMKDIHDPETKMTVWKRARLVATSRSATPERSGPELKTRPDLRISALGSGSDYTVFIDHLGVASLNLGYGGEDDGGGQYHSIYDDFYWYTHFEDTDFAYGRALAQTAGHMMMRLADAASCPSIRRYFADTIHNYMTEMQKLDGDAARRSEGDRIPRSTKACIRRSKIRRRIMVPPSRSPLPPYLNFAPLENAVRRIDTRPPRATTKLLRRRDERRQPDSNVKLIKSER